MTPLYELFKIAKSFEWFPQGGEWGEGMQHREKWEVTVNGYRVSFLVDKKCSEIR